jgi:uncharacterized protein involved in exopolysaccharide biosynthesis
MAEDQTPDPVDVRAPRGATRSQPTMSIHLPASGALADAQPRFAPKLSVNGQDEISALKLAVPIVRRWPVILGSAAALMGIGALLAVVLPPRYTARTSFTVESGSNSVPLPKAMLGMMGQLGMALGSSMNDGPSPDYFTALARSRTIMETVLASHYTRDGRITTSGGTPLLELLDVKGDTPTRRLDNGVRQLRRMVRTTVDRKGEIVELTVADRQPQRAAAIANRVIDLVNKHNVEHRRSRSRQQRELTASILAQARTQLRMSEERLQNFLTRNRRFQQSPLLLFEENRLERDVQQKQELTIALAQAYEEARISEAGDIPVISVIDQAVPPARRSFPAPWHLLLGGLLLGGVTGLAFVYLLEARRTWIAEQQPDFLALRDAARAWKARLRGARVRA